MIKPAKQLKTQDKIKLSDDDGFEIFTVRAIVSTPGKRVLAIKLIDADLGISLKVFAFDEEVEVL